MDATTFDALTRRLASGLTRREMVRRILVGSVAIGVSGLGFDTASAAKRRCKRAGAFCKRSRECCPRQTNRRCKVQRNAGNSDTTCCGVEGAICGGKNNNGDDKPPFCCVNYECRGTRCRKA